MSPDFSIKDTERSKKDTLEMSFIMQKSERISAALYIATNHLSDIDTLRAELREKGVRLVSDIVRAFKGQEESRRDLLAAAVLEARTLSALFEIARRGKIITEKNALLLMEEVRALGDRVERFGEVAPVALSQSFFMDGMISLSQPSVVSDRIRTVRTESRPSATPLSQEVRRKAVLSFLQGNPQATIKQIATAPALPAGISEKTIQRELVALLAEGLIRREGERRWSRYSLV